MRKQVFEKDMTGRVAVFENGREKEILFSERPLQFVGCGFSSSKRVVWKRLNKYVAFLGVALLIL